MLHPVNGFAGADTVQVIGVEDGTVFVGGQGQPAAIAPFHIPPGTIVIADRIAAFHSTCNGFCGIVITLALVGDQLAVEGGQQVGPPDVGVGVGMGLGILAFDEPGGQIAGLVIVILIPVYGGAACRIVRGETELIQGAI